MTQATGGNGSIRRATGVFAALLAATALLAGCGTKEGPGAVPDRTTGSTPTASPTPSASPKETLLAAVPDEGESTFRFSGRDSSSKLNGRIDPESLAYEIHLASGPDKDGISAKMSFLTIKDKTWVKIKFNGHSGLPRFPDKWMSLDKSKITASGVIPEYDGADPGSAAPLIGAATSVEERGPGKYAGFIDVTEGNVGDALEEGEAAALGAAGRRVPFTATVGPDEHLASLVLKMPASGDRKAYQYVVQYSGFGSTPKISAPTGDAATKAPALVYEILNS
ncbi:hypothetical protein K7640_13845 [Micromonospora sp. PLK6-60]|uniref:hypothetical protein n=1 Tax=Micromonospora sp. PLK6-60 TaxID=2873383 RepID=UPI001CA61991|nr:hypothetical protein [Micromonospora sp. PLK6-60]MBY8872914.1 hypothetical protein [Micromonospora sp. PLK6-60]